MQDQVKFYLTYGLIDLVVLLVIFGTAIYLLRSKVVRESLRWICVVLGLYFISFLCEIILCCLAIFQLRGDVFGMGGYIGQGLIVLLGGSTNNIGFVIFS
ncbi:MAG: hypothetical protein ACKO96_08015 [Flammeovirgaceae bacterium]